MCPSSACGPTWLPLRHCLCWEPRPCRGGGAMHWWRGSSRVCSARRGCPALLGSGPHGDGLQVADRQGVKAGPHMCTERMPARPSRLSSQARSKSMKSAILPLVASPLPHGHSGSTVTEADDNSIGPTFISSKTLRLCWRAGSAQAGPSARQCQWHCCVTCTGLASHSQLMSASLIMFTVPPPCCSITLITKLGCKLGHLYRKEKQHFTTMPVCLLCWRACCAPRLPQQPSHPLEHSTDVHQRVWLQAWRVCHAPLSLSSPHN